MTTDEKAKAYDEALKWMRELYPGLHGATKEDAEHYFPELRESEDERIRKALIAGLTEGLSEHNWQGFGGATIDECIAWLEKQKEPEWSDIDREMLDRIIERGCCELPPRTRALTSDMIQWLQWMKEGRIAPKQKEQKPTDLPAGFYVDKDGKKYYTKELRIGNMRVTYVGDSDRGITANDCK